MQPQPLRSSGNAVLAGGSATPAQYKINAQGDSSILAASFGTALKLFDSRHLPASAAMAAATAAAIYLSPPTKLFVDGMESKSMWSGLHQRLLPRDKWFGLLDPTRISVAREPAASDLTTGSIAPLEPPVALPAGAEPADTQEPSAPAAATTP